MLSETNAVERITARELKERLDRGENVIIVDARSQHSFDASNGKPRGAVRIAPGSPDGEVERLPRDRLVVTV